MLRVTGLFVALVTTVLLAGGAALVSSPGTSAAEVSPDRRPDLVVTSLGGFPRKVEAGEGLTAKYSVKNVGRTRAGASTTGFYLSANRSKGKGDVRVSGDPTRSLRAGKAVSGRAALKVPQKTRARGYYPIACADDRRKVRESDEGNCRVAKRKVRVEAGVSFPLEPNPLSVTPTLDGSKSVTERIDASGGTISSTAADGTVFTLTLPKDALLSAEEITMTPVSSVGGLPLSKGLVAAVDLKPNGLLLLEPAKLEIEPLTSVPVKAQTGFSYHGGGADFHLQPLDFGPQLSFSLTHFSGYGVGQGTDADRSAQQKRYPLRTKAQYEQLASGALLPARQGQILGTDDGSNWEEEVGDLSVGYYRQVVKPLLQQAVTDDALAEEATQAGHGWVRQVQLLGLEGDPVFEAQIDEIYLLLPKILKNAIDKGSARCTSQKDGREVPRVLAMARTGVALGFVDLADIFGKVERCARFELDFETTMLRDPSSSTGFVDPKSTVHVRVPALELRVNQNLAFSGNSKPLEYVSWELEDQEPEDDITVEKGDIDLTRPFAVRGLALPLNPRETGPKGAQIALGPPSDVELHVDKGMASENYLLRHNKSGIVESETALTYHTVFWFLHESEYVETPPSGQPPYWAIGDWNYLGGSVWSEKLYSNSMTQFSSFYSEETSFRLRHTPGP